MSYNEVVKAKSGFSWSKIYRHPVFLPLLCLFLLPSVANPPDFVKLSFSIN